VDARQSHPSINVGKSANHNFGFARRRLRSRASYSITGQELPVPENPTITTARAPKDPEVIGHYHAHVYYDPQSSRDRAARLRERVAATFPEVTLGRWHDALVGPHPRSMFQIAFPCALLASFVPWLMLNRDGLVILLHPETGNDYVDHTEHAVWFGQLLPLRLDVLQNAQKAQPSKT
jgi:aromatic ring-cleaving dioxygenase